MKAIKTFRKMSRSHREAQYFQNSMEVTQEGQLVATGERNDGQVLEGDVKLEEEPEEQRANRRSHRRATELGVAEGKGLQQEGMAPMTEERGVPPSEPSLAPLPERKEEEEPDGQQTNRQPPRQAPPGEPDEAEGQGPENGGVTVVEKEHDLPPSDPSRAPPPEGKEETTDADAGGSRGRRGLLCFGKVGVEHTVIVLCNRDQH